MTSLQEQFFMGIKDIPYKNSGGCLFFCYAFKRFFEQNGGNLSTFRIVQYHYYYEEMEHNLKWTKNSIPIAMQHFTWTYEGKEYDGEGYRETYKADYRSVLDIPYDDLNEFCEIALLEDQWNLSFDRDNAIDVMKDTLHLDLEVVRQ